MTGPSQSSSIFREHFTDDYDPSLALKEKMGLAAGKLKRTPLSGKFPTVKVPSKSSGMQTKRSGGAEESRPNIRLSTSKEVTPSTSGALWQPVWKKPRLSLEKRQRKEVMSCLGWNCIIVTLECQQSH
ncbi:hypothetical protein HOLleu_16611 [Holothuria leucospilota]|uniref:Uncharacterized protein n=1 Tax=Holothuria leucospilota TaxID=206669 RepID=A0A9Q1C5G0_HOLLE|nr:hypothetical protein HOLleu_16611 [Holothuria leucospilota]